MDLHALAIRTVLGPLWAWWEGSPYLAHYRHLCRNQFDTPERIEARQWTALQTMLRHAASTVPFYRQSFRQAGLRPEDIHCMADYRRLPVLTKTDIRIHGADLLSERYDPSHLHLKQTSGSTGIRLTIFVDEASLQHKRACTLRADEWSGWRFGERVAWLWGNPDHGYHTWHARLRRKLLERVRALCTLRMTETDLARFAAQLRHKPPSLLFGHAHSLYLFACFLRDRGLAGAIRPNGIIATAMVLHPWQRRVIEDVFTCPVTNRYGCEEVSLIACECERHHGLHVNADGVLVELLRGGQAVAPGEAGSVIVTDLTNRAMPLLRYQVGDVAVRATRPCPCGRGLPLLESIEGREADYVVTPGGELISGISLTENLACQVPGVAQIQIVQETRRHFRFRLVRGPDFGAASLQRLHELVVQRFGPEVGYECEYLEHIPQEASGKYRFCISHVENPFTRPQEVGVS
jgi:phenylacetate-CoA ligase